MDRGRLVVQANLDDLRAPTGLVEVRTTDPDRAAAALDGKLESREAERLLVRHPDAASLNAELVAAGIRVTEIRAQRRSLEDVVLAATSGSADRVDRS
jgi:ABC-2 type transport system ATP-binding protein